MDVTHENKGVDVKPWEGTYHARYRCTCGTEGRTSANSSPAARRAAEELFLQHRHNALMSQGLFEET